MRQGANNAYSYFHFTGFGDIYGHGSYVADNRCMASLGFFNATRLTFAPRAGKFASVDVVVNE